MSFFARVRLLMVMILSLASLRTATAKPTPEIAGPCQTVCFVAVAECIGLGVNLDFCVGLWNGCLAGCQLVP